MNPIMTGPRISGLSRLRSMVSAASNPSRNEPEALIARVPHGNPPRVRPDTQPSTR